MKSFAGRCHCRTPHIIINAHRKTRYPDRPWFIEVDVFGFYFGVEGNEATK